MMRIESLFLSIFLLWKLVSARKSDRCRTGQKPLEMVNSGGGRWEMAALPSYTHPPVVTSATRGFSDVTRPAAWTPLPL